MEVRKVEIVQLPDGRMDSDNAAAYLGLSKKTLAIMRMEGTGPVFIKRGRIFYYQVDLDAWLNEFGKMRSTAESRRTAG